MKEIVINSKINKYQQKKNMREILKNELRKKIVAHLETIQRSLNVRQPKMFDKSKIDISVRYQSVRQISFFFFRKSSFDLKKKTLQKGAAY